MSNRYESRGVRCLECAHIELQGDKEAAKRGFGRCAAVETRGFVSFAMSRNCLEFDRAPDEVVGPRDQWAGKLKMFWQK